MAPHKSVQQTLATEEASRSRSFARTHARTQRKRNRNRFPGSGGPSHEELTPPTSDLVSTSTRLSG